MIKAILELVGRELIKISQGGGHNRHKFENYCIMRFLISTIPAGVLNGDALVDF